jgi:hypothetical protein
MVTAAMAPFNTHIGMQPIFGFGAGTLDFTGSTGSTYNVSGASISFLWSGSSSISSGFSYTPFYFSRSGASTYGVKGFGSLFSTNKPSTVY